MVILLIVMIFRSQNNSQNNSQNTSATSELAGRLQQIADSSQLLQASVAEQLQRQERELSKKLEERLADVSTKVGHSLIENLQTTQKSLSAIGERLAVIDTAQQNITDLSTQMMSLQDILSNKDKRGLFGEIQLQDIIKNALPPSAFHFQKGLSNGKIVDCLLELPAPSGAIAIDSKFPLENYEKYIAADDDVEKKEAAKALKANITQHIKDIADKYIIEGETAEYALMFLPSESICAELHARFSSVVQDAFKRKVAIVSPSTMMATVTTVRAILKDHTMREQAGLIQKEVLKMARDVELLDERAGKLQSSFETTTKRVNEIRTSAGRILSRSEKIESVHLEDTSAANDADELSSELEQEVRKAIGG